MAAKTDPPPQTQAARASAPPQTQAARASAPPAEAQAARASAPPAEAQTARASAPPAEAQAARASAPPAEAQAAEPARPRRRSFGPSRQQPKRPEAKTDLQRVARELLFASFMRPSQTLDDPRIFDRLAAAIETQTVRAGDVLYREGDEADYVLFMTEGRLRLSREGRHDWVYEGRWVIGAIDILIGDRRRRTATAETSARLTRMSAARWFEAIRDRPDVLVDTLSDFARGCCELYARLAPDAGFAQPALSAPPLDASGFSGRARALASLPLLRGVSAQVIFEVAALATTRPLAPDEVLFEAGTSPRRAFVVTRGLVEVRRADPDASATFAAGSLVGGALFLGDVTASWTARARGPAEVLSFSIDDLFDHLEEHYDSLRAVLGTFSFEQERLREELSEREGELLLR